jgi:CBS-domain-containing membrane protein
MKVKDIMTRQVKSIPADMSAEEALRQLMKLKISGLPVLDKEARLLGMFTEKDVLSYVLPSYIEKVGRFIYEENLKSVKKKFSELPSIKVERLRRREVVTTREEATLSEAARIMLTQKARRLPVLDKDNLVVGIVSRDDILRALAEEAAR